MSNEMGMTFDPTVGERLVRSKARIGRLRQALKEENEKACPNIQRVKDLTDELDWRVNQIKEFTEGVL